MEKEGNVQNSRWPLPIYNYQVSFGDFLPGLGVQEISGLNHALELSGVTDNSSAVSQTEATSGIINWRKITLERCIFVSDQTFWNWHTQISMNVVGPCALEIIMLNNNQNIAKRWKLENAQVIKMSNPVLMSDGNEVTIKTIEIHCMTTKTV